MDTILKITGKTTKDINSFFEKWHEHTELMRLETIRALQLFGQLSTKYKNEFTEDMFKCPLFGFVLMKACGVGSCQYYLPTSSTNIIQQKMVADCKNCLINCLDISKNNRMSAQEIAGVLGISVSEINANNANAIAKIRRSKIKEQIEKHQIPRFQYLTGHCIACEQYIQDELEMHMWPDLVIQPGVHGWCSEECKEKKPKWQFLIEKEFECYYLHALTIGYLLYKNIENLGSIFFLNKEIIIKNETQIQRNLDFLKINFYQQG